MGILPDWAIRRDVKIEPFSEGIKRDGVISYGVTSYGYDARIGYKFRVFSPVNCTEVDPKNFNEKAYIDVDLTPEFNHTWTLEGTQKRCYKCGAWEGTPSEKSLNYQCPSKKPNYILIPPHSFVLGETVETFTIPRDCLCIVLGKSTYARCGLVVNVTPGEPEWVGKWTVEISNTTPLPARVYCGEGIMQCIFLRSDAYTEELLDDLDLQISDDDPECKVKRYIGSCRTSYADKKGKYQNQKGLTLPTVDKNTDTEKK